MNYTKGEWKVEQKDEKHGLFFDGFTLSVKTKDLIIALCDRDKWDHKKERLANANLIAAAPELLEACEYAMLELAVKAGDKLLRSPEWVEFSNRAKQALAKAAGKESK